MPRGPRSMFADSFAREVQRLGNVPIAFTGLDVAKQFSNV
jgi:hypothetical protein